MTKKDRTFIEVYYWNKNQEQRILGVQDIIATKIILIENYIMRKAYARHQMLERIFGDVINEKIPFTK